MDKNTIIGFVLIGLVLIMFTWMNKPTPEQIEARRVQDSVARVEQAKRFEEIRLQEEAAAAIEIEDEAYASDSARIVERERVFGVFASSMEGTEGTEGYTTLENDRLEVRVSSRGGQVSYARLKDYTTHDSLPLILFDGEESSLSFTLITATNRVVNTSDLYFTPLPGNDPRTLTMRLNADGGGHLDFVYTLDDEYMLQYSIRGEGLNGVLSPGTNAIDMKWDQMIRQQEKGRKYEDQYTGLYYKFVADDVENLSQSGNRSQRIPNRLRWIAYKDKFFSTILISDDGFESTTLDSRQIGSGAYLKRFSTVTSVPFDLQGREATSMRYYFGPNQYSQLKSYDRDASAGEQLDLEELVPLGASVFRWMNQYFILPIFDFLGRHVSSMGLVIFLLTLIVKTILFPLTYKGYMSSAKMRVLRPQVEALNAKYPGQDKALERQKATMDLYSRAGASPMSGCLPMLLQMPILIALYMLFPASIELRHQSFLWAQDLSAYDAVISWSAYIPIVSPYFGNHLSLFCLLMVIVNIVYAKFNMEMTNTGQQQMPGMKFMMVYMMPLMLLVFLNQSASGLSYYYFISTLITILQTLGFRFLINEEKLLAKLETNKKKPAKKSGFMKRLEDMQKQQQEILRKQQNQKKK
ncbi:MAG: membrane protein insertase YidC [Tannerellaceae bacterium]|jgi:YidC/Oxa1 family membrane protein insertase|nr:membrane protein insertase YidC [Tannerellaceae bacterium]